MSWFAGFWLSGELVTRCNYFSKMALGWRFCSFLGAAYVIKSLFTAHSAPYYAPVLGAYLRKYNCSVKRDLFEIKDPKKEYFYIDTSEYMNYKNEDLSDEYHVHHGPQPVSYYLFRLD